MKLSILLFLLCLAAFIGANAQTNRGGRGGVVSVALARNQNQPSAIAADEASVYWVSDSGATIKKVSKAGGAPTALVINQKHIHRIIVDGDNIFFNTDDEIRQVNKKGGAPNPIAKFASSPSSETSYLAVDEANIYFVDHSNTVDQIMKVPKGGGEPVTLVSGIAYLHGLASDGANIYWANYADDTVNRVGVNGGQGIVFSRCNVPHDVAVDADSVYCTSGEIMKFRKTDGVLIMRAAIKNVLIDTIALDETNVYAMSSYQGGLYKISKSGGRPVLLATFERFQPSNFVVDDANIYWTKPRSGTVMRIHK